MQRRCGEALEKTLAARGIDTAAEALGVGVGVRNQVGDRRILHLPQRASHGHRCMQVNLTARLESQAAAGEIHVPAEAAAQAPELLAATAIRELSLKGINQPSSRRIVCSVHEHRERKPLRTLPVDLSPS